MKPASWPRNLMVRALFATLVMIALWASGAQPAVARQEVTPTPTPTPAVAIDQRIIMSATELWPYALFLILLTIVGWLLLFGHLARVQGRFYDVFEQLALMGRAPRVMDISAIAQSSIAPLEKQTPNTLEIKGPGLITVGVQSGEYTATLGGQPANQATWTVEPGDAASLNPLMGASTRLTATKVGAFKLTVTVPEVDKPAVLCVAAVGAQSSPGEMPFVGSGFGSIAIAILLVTTVVLLALRGVLSGEMVATFFGALVGYVFGVRSGGGTGGTAGGQGGKKEKGGGADEGEA
jgi:hypothetical protein